MYELIIEIMNKYGIVGIIFIIVIFLIKAQPVTLVTSTNLELKLLSKEKRFSHLVLNYIIEVLSLSVVITTLTFFFLSSKLSYNNYIAMPLGVFVLIGTFILTYFDTKNLFIFEFVTDRGIRKIVLFIYSIYLMSCIILPTYYVGTNFPAELYSGVNGFEKILRLIALFITYFILLIFIFKPIKKKLTSSFKNQEKKSIYIEIDNMKWYIFHPIDNEYFYLGNKFKSEESTEYRFLKREDLVKTIIKVETI